MQTIHTEETLRTKDLKKMRNMYLAERLLRKWSEDFVDEDTGETVSIDRNELIFESGTFLGSDEIAQINFMLQSESIKDVLISNQQRACNVIKNHVSVWVAQAEINRKKKNIYLYSDSIEVAKAIVEDFVSQKYSGVFSIKSIKETKFCNLLSDEMEEEIDDNVNEEDLDYYKIEVSITNEDYESYNQTFILKSTDAEKAKETIIKYLTFKRLEDNDKSAFDVVIIAAKTITCEDVIDYEFSKEHLEHVETK